MKQLVPREAMDIDETGYWSRMPIAVGIFFGSFMGATCLLMPLPGDQSHAYVRALAALVVALVSGILFGIGFPLRFRKAMRRMQDKVYLGEPPFNGVPPPNLSLEYRLPATLVDGSPSVGGALYFGPSDVLFVPHPSGKRGTETLRLGSPATIEFQPRHGRLTAWNRLFLARAATIVDVVSGDNRRSFIIPAPSSTITEIDAVLTRLAPDQRKRRGNA
jgi:hypothetical protein